LSQTPTSDLDYNLLESSIAQYRYSNPEDSKLLDAKDRHISTFTEYINNLEEQSVFIFNRSTVQDVRITTEKSKTQGKIEFFILSIKDEYKAEVMIKTSGTIQIGSEIETLLFSAQILSKKDGVYTVKFSENVAYLISEYGKVPLPPYIKDDSSKYSDYKNEFSDGGFSVASSTAGLHFSNKMIKQLENNGHRVFYLNLDINLGTFKPINTDIIEDYKIHSESYQMRSKDYEEILGLKKSGFKIVLVGTTVLRTLETVFTTGKLSGETNLFITPGYQLNIGDYLITNFHAPKSSLLSIVQTIYGDNWKNLYDYAQKNNLQFLSFGDAVLFKMNE
tara:strand:+ start:4150 stop:5151 length:1002 start_codon:yes stop_codon:yes gene_type:complete